MLGFSGILMSALYYMALLNELAESVYNPCFSVNDLYTNTYYAISGFVELGNEKNQGELTNWSDRGCFFYLGKDIDSGVDNVKLNITFLETLFELEGKMVTKNSKGIGILFIKKEAHEKWNELLTVLKDRGYVAEI